MTLALVVEPSAARDVAEALAYHAQHDRGDAFLSELDRAFDQIAELPLMYPIVYASVRRALLRRFAYSVFFVIESERAVVLAVHHQRRDPSARLER